MVRFAMRNSVERRPERPPPTRPFAVLGLALEVGYATIAVLGVLLTLYASLCLPTNGHCGLTDTRGWIQFGCAVAVPVVALIAVKECDSLRRGSRSLARALVSLTLAPVCFGAWLLVFFEH